MLLYIYSKCSTCQKALRFLKEKNIPFVCKEIKDTPPTVEELKKMLVYLGGNKKKLFNTSGQLYREMQLSEKLSSLSDEEALQLLSRNGMLVKRPFLLGKTFGLTGFKESEWVQKIES
jgi:arsenate reductase